MLEALTFGEKEPASAQERPRGEAVRVGEA